jgi:hypothetical protein
MFLKTCGLTAFKARSSRKKLVLSVSGYNVKTRLFTVRRCPPFGGSGTLFADLTNLTRSGGIPKGSISKSLGLW